MSTAQGLYGTGLTNPNDVRHPRWLSDREQEIATCLSIMARADAQRERKRRELAELNRHLDDLTTDLRLEIAEETNGGGKPKYSNAESRAAAVKQALRKDPTAHSLGERIAACEVAIAELDQQFETARRQRQSAHAAMSYAAAWLGYWAAQQNEQE
jgi:chromosome segregation ATPase